MLYSKEPIEKFIKDLSAKLPAPGGGSAAALTGAIAASLNCMVANFTIGHEKYKEFEKECSDLLNESVKLRDELLNLMQADTEAYTLVLKSYKMPKETDSQILERDKAIEEVLKKAAEIPYKMISICYRILLICKPLLIKGNKNLVSDVGVSATLALSSMKSAFLNVKINFFYLKDKEYKDKIMKEINLILKEADSLEREVWEECNKRF
ncbi:MAG: cyclodeaminase/cyclohydrolase family protein [Candidatus Firestonebacteria bacterium]